MKDLIDPIEGRTLKIDGSFGYEIESKDRISIHVNHGIADKNPKAKVEFLEKSLRTLARLLVGMDELKGIKTIEIISWMAAEKPRLLERFGFTVETDPSEVPKKMLDKYRERMEKLKEQVENGKLEEDVMDMYKPDVMPGYAYVNREKFLDLYYNAVS